METVLTFLQQIGPYINKTYTCFMTQTINEGKMFLAMGAIAPFIFFLLFMASNWVDEIADFDGFKPITGIMFILSIIVSLILIPNGILMLINPNYYTIHDIASLIK